MRFLVAGILGVALLCGACSKSGETAQEREVRAALESHLQKKGNLALNNMNMEIQNVKITGDTAEAQVRFQSKQKPELAVGIHYVLRRAGDHWEVESSSPVVGMGADSHQAAETPSTPGGTPATSTPAGATPEASH
jgi:hypothetical protein